MIATTQMPVTTRQSLSNTVTYGSVNISILLTGEDTGGAFSLFESVMRPGTEPLYHIHEHEDETVCVLEGHLSVMVDGKVHECRAGDTIFLPRGVAHTFRVRSSVVRGLTMVTPPGFEKFFQAVGEPAMSLDPPPAGPATPEYREKSGRAAAAFGVRLADQQPQF